jgi:hypothetical protein
MTPHARLHRRPRLTAAALLVAVPVLAAFRTRVLRRAAAAVPADGPDAPAEESRA